MQKLADKLGIPINMCHFRPGTSKWDPIELRLRLFASIYQNWRGRPLKTLNDMIKLISHIRTQTGLKVLCQSDLME